MRTVVVGVLSCAAIPAHCIRGVRDDHSAAAGDAAVSAHRAVLSVDVAAVGGDHAAHRNAAPTRAVPRLLRAALDSAAAEFLGGGDDLRVRRDPLVAPDRSPGARENTSTSGRTCI